jgi:hypothetical protein
VAVMTNAEPARHALYAELEQVLGVEHAETLMTHLPQHTSDSVVTKADMAGLETRFDARFDRMEDRFDRMEDRFDRMEDRMDKMQRNFLTVSFGTLTAMTGIFAFISHI